MNIRSFIPAALFCALLALPTTLALLRADPFTPLSEYRKLAPFPEASVMEAKGLDEYFRDIALWHSDNFVSRPFWIRLRTQWLFSVFAESDEVYVGDDGWMFYRTVADVQLPGLEALQPQDIQHSVDQYARLSKAMAELGVTLYVMPIPLKNYFYEEKLTGRLRRVREYKNFDRYMDAMATNPSVAMIDLRAPLLEAKREGLQIFHKTDFHWTDPAAGVAGRILLKRMVADSSADFDTGWWTYRIAAMPDLAGGQSRFLPLFAPPVEDSIQIGGYEPQQAATYVENSGDFETVGRLDAPPPTILPPIYVFGDSFWDGVFRTGFTSNFKSYYRAKRYKAYLARSFMSRDPTTKFAVIEFISVAWPSMDVAVGELLKELEAQKALAN